MKPKNIVDALDAIDYDMIEEAEMVKKTFTLKLRGKKTVLIAAAVSLLLCGTAAGAGLLWMKPDVQPNADGHTLFINQGYIDLPDDAVQTIMEKRIPERNYNCFLNFETVAEWQEFFDLPLVVSNLLVPNETNSWTQLSPDSELVPKGSIDTYITSLDKEGGTQLGIMGTSINVERIYTDEDESERIAWHGSMNIRAALSEEAAEEASHTVILNDAKSGEIVMEFTTPSGIPCVISKTASEKYDQTAFLYLLYGYDSVFYELQVDVHSTEQEMIILKDLQKIADTLRIIYPMN